MSFCGAENTAGDETGSTGGDPRSDQWPMESISEPDPGDEAMERNEVVCRDSSPKGGAADEGARMGVVSLGSGGRWRADESCRLSLRQYRRRCLARSARAHTDASVTIAPHPDADRSVPAPAKATALALLLAMVCFFGLVSASRKRPRETLVLFTGLVSLARGVTVKGGGDEGENMAEASSFGGSKTPSNGRWEYTVGSGLLPRERLLTMRAGVALGDLWLRSGVRGSAGVILLVALLFPLDPRDALRCAGLLKKGDVIAGELIRRRCTARWRPPRE